MGPSRNGRFSSIFKVVFKESLQRSSASTTYNPLHCPSCQPFNRLQRHPHYPSRQLAYRAATKLLRPCLSLASLWMVPQLWFIFFISTSAVLHRLVFGRPRFRVPSGVRWIATLVMELASLRSTYPIQRYRFLVMMVSISSCWHRAKRSRLEMVLGPKDALDFPAACRVKGRQLGKVLFSHPPAH